MNQNPVDGQITIIDADGNEKLCQILFTLDSEEFNKKYVVFYEISSFNETEDDEEIPLMAASYVEGSDGEGELSEIESDEEWAFIEAAVNDFNEKCAEEEEDSE